MQTPISQSFNKSILFLFFNIIMNIFISPRSFNNSSKETIYQISFIFLYSHVLVNIFPQSLGYKTCPQSIPTVSYVSRCPANAEEWKSAAAKKDCKAVERTRVVQTMAALRIIVC